MKKKSRPDPEEFARKLLWYVSGIRSEVRIMLQMLSRQIEPNIQKADEIYSGWINRAVEVQEKLYKDALEEAGIPPTKETCSESTED